MSTAGEVGTKRFEWLMSALIALIAMPSEERRRHIADIALRAAMAVHVEDGAVVGAIASPLPEQREAHVLLGQMCKFESLGPEWAVFGKTLGTNWAQHDAVSTAEGSSSKGE